MWKQIHSVAGDWANRASKLAVDVLDAGPPEKLMRHGEPSVKAEPSEESLNDRLSLLKARYRHSTTDSPQKNREIEIEGIEGTSMAGPLLEDNSDVVKWKDQVERLKAEILRQTTIAEESLRQQKFEWAEQMKQLENQHRLEIQKCRKETALEYQHLLNAKEKEVEDLKALSYFENQEESLVQDLNQKRKEIETLQQQIAVLQQKELNAAFGTETGNESQEMLQLQHDYEELMIKCHRLEEERSQMVSAEQLNERDAFWRSEIQRIEAAHSEALEQQSHSKNDVSEDALRRALEEERKTKETLQKQSIKHEEEIERLNQALKERDSIWQQELISSQNQQQTTRKELESLKRQLEGISKENQRVGQALEKCQAELRNEVELRTAAQSHVRSLQKSMMEMESGTSNVKQRLVDVETQKTELQKSYEKRLQEKTQSAESQIAQFRRQNQIQQESIQSLHQKMEEMEEERQRLETEVQRFMEMKEKEGQVDVTQLLSDLEASKENLRLLESRNSLMSLEIESLTQELTQMRKPFDGSQQNGFLDEDSKEMIRKLESERDSCKGQLKRLKNQMIQMQEDQEASLHWRIDAEVKLAIEAFKKTFSGDSSLKDQIVALEKQLKTAQESLQEYKTQMEQKDKELTNLQIALGELTYHGEAADKLRRDLRAAQEEIKHLNEAILDHKATVAESQSARKAAEASADEAHRQIVELNQRIQQLEGNVFSTKKELMEVSTKLRRIGNDEASMVDRRLVVQLLVAYLEKKHSQDALEVMAKMLGFTEEEKRKVALSVTGRGLLGSVAGSTMALVRGGMSVATFGLLDKGLKSETGSQLADQWVHFLIEESDPVSKEDPLAYLQKGTMKDSPTFGETDSVRVTSSETSASFQALQRYGDEGKRHRLDGYHLRGLSQSSKSEEPSTPVHATVPHGFASSEIRPFSGLNHPAMKTPMPSFKDFLERKRDLSSDS